MHALASTYQVCLFNISDVNIIWGRFPRSRKAHSIEVKVIYNFLTACGCIYEITHNAQQYKCRVQS